MLRTIIARSAVAGAVTLAGVFVSLAVGSGPAMAQQASLEGSWSGGGTVVFPSGERERARCRATFRRQGASGYVMNAVCATPSARVSQSAEIRRVSGNRFSGEFTNTEFGVNGSIRITLEGKSLHASLSGGGGSAQFALSK